MGLFSRKALVATVATIGMVFSGYATADTISADINDDAVKLEYKATNTSSNLDVNGSVLLHDEDGEIYSLGAMVEGRSLHQSNIAGSLGGKLYLIDLEGDADGFALGLGGEVRIQVPNVNGLTLQAELYYAPQVLSFDDIQRHVDFTTKAKYRILDNGSVYLGYRKANIDVDDYGSGDLDEGIHIGIELDL